MRYGKLVCAIICSQWMIFLLPSSMIQPEEFSQRRVPFDRSDGTYSNAMMQEDFGNGRFYSGGNDHIKIAAQSARITYLAGNKVKNTGIGWNTRIPVALQATLKYKIRYRSEERRVGQECRSRWSPYP